VWKNGLELDIKDFDGDKSLLRHIFTIRARMRIYVSSTFNGRQGAGVRTASDFSEIYKLSIIYRP